MMPLQGATVLVTGGTGFIGSRLIEVLVEQFGAKVKVLLRSTAAGVGAFRAACYDVEFVEASILNEAQLSEALKNVDYVFHCAFGSLGNKREQRNVTVSGTRTLVKAAAKTGVKRLVNLSSVVVFGDRTPNVVDETFAPLKPWRWNYAIDKWDAEQIVAAEHNSDGLVTTTIRLGAVYGPWGPAFTFEPIMTLATNRIALAADGTGVSSATYIDDAVQGIILAALRPQTTPEIYIISGSDRVTWREFYASYEVMTGRQGIVPMTVDEIHRVRRMRLVAGLQGILPAAIKTLKESRDFRRAVADLPLVRTIYANQLSRKRRTRRDGSATRASTSPDPLPVILPPKEMISYLSSQTEYSTKKAETELGYRPQFNLRSGMALTEAWAHWARLV
jgi:nucleoside-diphosphate-sugar epimerase